MAATKNKSEVIRVCRICLSPEEHRQFNNFFDRRYDFAEKLFYLSNLKVKIFLENLTKF